MVYIDSADFPFRIRQGKAIASKKLKAIPVRLLFDAIFQQEVINPVFAPDRMGFFGNFADAWLPFAEVGINGYDGAGNPGRFGIEEGTIGGDVVSITGGVRMADWNHVGEEAARAVRGDVESGKAMSAHCREDKRQPARGGCLVSDEPGEMFFALPLGR